MNAHLPRQIHNQANGFGGSKCLNVARLLEEVFGTFFVGSIDSQVNDSSAGRSMAAPPNDCKWSVQDEGGDPNERARETILIAGEKLRK